MHYSQPPRAGITQLVEFQLPKLDVAGSSPVARSTLTSEGLQYMAEAPVFFLTRKSCNELAVAVLVAMVTARLPACCSVV